MEAIPITQTTTLKAIVTKTNWANSPVSSETYTLALPVCQITPASGAYPSAQTCEITNSVSGVTIYYTTNGTTPTSGSPVYSGSFQIGTNTTIKAFATKTDFTDSEVITKEYTRAGMPLLCWQLTGKYSSGRVFVLNGGGEHPKTFDIPKDVETETICLVDEGKEIDKSKYELNIV